MPGRWYPRGANRCATSNKVALTPLGQVEGGCAWGGCRPGVTEVGVSGKADQVMVRGMPKHVVGYLKEFLFDEGQARAPVRSLLFWLRRSRLKPSAWNPKRPFFFAVFCSSVTWAQARLWAMTRPLVRSRFSSTTFHLELLKKGKRRAVCPRVLDLYVVLATRANPAVAVLDCYGVGVDVLGAHGDQPVADDVEAATHAA